MSITVEGFEGMISGSLGITEPWYIKECKVDSKTQTMHIYVSVREEAKFACPKGGGDTKRYRYGKNERVCQHGNVFFRLPIDKMIQFNFSLKSGAFFTDRVQI